MIEEITVTGSNIRRKRDFETPSPIQTLDSEIIAASGSGQMQDLLRILPANAGSEINAAQTDRQGTSQFSLRGLGVGGTLTLINGRRAGLAPVTTTQGFFYTDINQYPSNMIESIEVLLDGASATYGSEAVGGVVNIITRRNFEGLEFGLEYRENDLNPAESVNAAFGAPLDRGHFTIFANYYHQDRAHRGDYDWLASRADAFSTVASENLFDSSTGAGRYNAAIDPDGDGFYDRIGNTVADPNCGQPNPLSGITNTFVDGTNCRYIFVNQRTLVAEQTRVQVFSQFDYDVSDNVTVFAEASYSSNEVLDTIGGAVMDLRLDDDGHFVPGSHPFNYFVDNGGTLTWDPAAVAADPSLAVDVIFRGRPLTTFDGDLGEDITRQFDNTRLAFGFDANLSDRWSLNSSFVFATSNLKDIQPRSYYTPAFRDAIASGAWNPFASAWATPNAISVKDGVSVAGNTVYGPDSDLALFSVNRTFVKETTQSVLEVILSGDLFEVNGNLVTAAFGAQYRDTEFSDIADSLSEFQIDGRTDPVFSIEDSSQDVYALFAEASVPLTDALELQLALRYEDYGDGEGGDTTDPKLGFRWAATDIFQLRGSIGTSFQAPSIRNIAGSVGSGVLPDPITAAVFAGGPGTACDSNVTDSFNSSQITTGGGLVPQDATNWNLGTVFDVGNFTASIDYWSYEFTDLIGPGEAFGSIVAGECSNGVYTPDARVGRNGVGQLSEVTTSFVNLGGVDTDGIDFTGAYTFDEVMGGALSLNATATVINSFDIDFGDGSPTFDGKGNRNSFIDLLGSVPDFRLNVGANWYNDKQNASVFVRHIGGYDDREPDSANDSIDSFTVVDLQYGYTFDGLIGSGSTNIVVGMNNVADEDPPAIDRGSVNGRIGFDGQVHDPRGRITYVRFTQSF
ncbi:MAG: TonB-dependent receptor [Pseudomonadota bacterium]